jgi:adenosylmethionine-8-amino-7-oxononanoate aminotransferase
VELPGPIGERIGPKVPSGQADHERLANAEDLLSDVAAVITDYTQGGVYYSSAYQDRLAGAAAKSGTLWIADEVVTGFGRTGGWFSFQGGESRPDIVTLGKGLGAGAAPAGAVVISRRLAERLQGATWQSVATFRGHPITVAAVRAHLRVLLRDKLVERVKELDGLMYELMSELAAAHPSVERIDGRGLHWTVELHGPDWRSWHADTAEVPLATRVAARALEAGALIQTSGEQASLVLAPPFIVEEDHLRRLALALDHGLAIADQEFERAAGTSGSSGAGNVGRL